MNWWKYSILKEWITIKTSEKQNKPIVDESQQKFFNCSESGNAIPKIWTDAKEILRTRLSKKERRVDALALRADERRDKLRKAAGRSKYP